MIELPIRVLHVIGIMNRGGAESMLMNIYRNIDCTKVQFDFVENSFEPAAYDEEITALGGKIYRCPHHVGRNHLQYVHWWKNFFREHRDEYKIIHGHLGSTAAIYLKIAKKYGLFTIAHSHSASKGIGVSGVLYSMMSYPTRNIADQFFACSVQAGISRYGKRIGADSNKCKLLKNAIDINQFTFDQDIRNQYRHKFEVNEKLVIGHVGRFVDVKNHTYLIDVFSKMHKRDKNAVLYLVGDGPLRPDMENKVRKLGLENSVYFLGVRKDIANLMQMFDVFVLPSLYEGLPVTLIEAQTAALPCVCSTVVTRDVNITGLCSFIDIKNQDIDEWCSTIRKVANGERKDTSKQITEAGYNIKETSIWLQNYYCKLV